MNPPKPPSHQWLLPAMASLLCGCATIAGGEEKPSRQAIIDRMQPYQGPHVREADPTTLDGKVLCGYQGWFCAAGDGADRGWYHYGLHGRFEPGYCSIDLWPDVAELPPDERYPTPFRHADGSTAYVFGLRNAGRPSCGTSSG